VPDNPDVERIFNQMADLLEIEGANAFRVRAYRAAARAVGTLPGSVARMIREGRDLTEIQGIGKDLAGKIGEIVATGRLAALEEVRSRVRPELCLLARIDGLGPRRVRLLSEQLGIETLDGLIRAAEAGKLRELPGFGARLEERILAGARRAGETGGRVLRPVAEASAASLLAHLRAVPGVVRVEAAGSFRRGRETVGDLDLLAVAADPGEIMRSFAAFPDMERTVAGGATKAAGVLFSGLEVDLRVVPARSMGAALHYFTGSKAHNVAVRGLARKLGLKVNEYGIFRVADNALVGGGAEEEVFAAVGLPYIPPELRENAGEIEAAAEGRLPRLLAQADLRGDLHTHSEHTDGRAAIEEMALAARSAGLDYMAVTDHSQRLKMVRGLTPERLLAQAAEIDALNARTEGFRVLKGCEVDILEDGTLDMPDEVLDRLDLTVCSLHSALGLPAERQTARVLRALDNPRLTILGHPTNRLIGSRPPSELDMEAVVAKAARVGAALELNAQPDRLDLTDVHCRMARDAGVQVAVSTDAHSPSELSFVRYGVLQARRGWLGPDDVLNARPLQGVLDFVARRKGVRQ